MNKEIQQGKIKPEEVHMRIAVYSQIEKRAKMMLSAFALAAKYGKVAMKNILNTNLIGEGSFIDLEEDQEVDKIMCSNKGTVITRNECLDFSGASDNFEKCSECNHFIPTRRMLLHKKG